MACLQSVSHNLAACDKFSCSQNAPVLYVVSSFQISLRTKSNATWAESVGLSCIHAQLDSRFVRSKFMKDPSDRSCMQDDIMSD